MNQVPLGCQAVVCTLGRLLGKPTPPPPAAAASPRDLGPHAVWGHFCPSPPHHSPLPTWFLDTFNPQLPSCPSVTLSATRHWSLLPDSASTCSDTPTGSDSPPALSLILGLQLPLTPNPPIPGQPWLMFCLAPSPRIGLSQLEGFRRQLLDVLQRSTKPKVSSLPSLPPGSSISPIFKKEAS